MTKQEAIEEIEDRFDIMDYCESRSLEEALEIAIEALEKQIELDTLKNISND